MRIHSAAIQRQVLPRWAFLVCGLAMAMMAGSANATGCPIDGPTTVGANQSFTLCGMPASGYSYEWHGQGLTVSSTSRCVTVSGRSAGSYEYELIIRRGGIEVERCSQTVAVGGGGFGSLTCAISGPTSIASGSSATLCAPQSSRHSYRWSGPGGFTASTPCVTASRPGTYYLSIVNDLTGYSRECSHTLTIGGTGSAGGCAIAGPDVVGQGSNVRLCAPASSDAIYRWDGPNNFTAASRCVVAHIAGTYYLTVRSRSTGAEEQCSHQLDAEGSGNADGTDDADLVASDNCPRALAFWQQQCRRAADGRQLNPNDFSIEDLRAIARRVDELSRYFNWPDDVTGLCAALNPPRPLTNRKQAIRQFAALMANVAAGELEITTRSGDAVSLDPATSGSFLSANTVGELIALSDRMLTSGRGSFSRLGQYLNAVNRGRGIGPVCQ